MSPDARSSQTRPNRQPDGSETRLISPEELVAEVKSIYAGLVMIESKYIEVHSAQSPQETLSIQAYHALISLHQTMLHEHHDFFLASQHPSAGSALKRLASKYSMPARMLRYDIHNLLELLKARLPSSMEDMLDCIYKAYSMITTLRQTGPEFEDTCIECLGDLAQYRMAIEDDDNSQRAIRQGVVKAWLSKALMRAPIRGGHLTYLQRQLLYYYDKWCPSMPVPFSLKTISGLYSSTKRQDTTIKEKRLYSPRGWYDNLHFDRCPLLDRLIDSFKSSSALSPLSTAHRPSDAWARSDVGNSEIAPPAHVCSESSTSRPRGEVEPLGLWPSLGGPSPQVSSSGRGKKPMMLLAFFLTSAAVVIAQGPSDAVRWGTCISGMLASVSGYSALKISPGPGVDVQATWYVVTTTSLPIMSFANAVPFVLLLGAWLPRDERTLFHILQLLVTMTMSTLANAEVGMSPNAHHWLEYVPLLGVLAAIFAFLLVRLPRHEMPQGGHSREE